MSDGGKGSTQRPGTGYAEGHERIWGKKETKPHDSALGQLLITPVKTDNGCQNPDKCSNPFCNCEVKHGTE